MTFAASPRADRSAGVLPLGHTPDWEGIVARLHAAGALNVGRGVTGAEAEREAIVLALAVFLAGDAPGRTGSMARLGARQLATSAGLREERARHGLAHLAHAGLLVGPDGAPLELPSATPTWDDQLALSLADVSLRPAPIARLIRWDAVRSRAGTSTRALAATAAFLDLIPVPDEWTCVSLAAVGAVARYTGRKSGEAVQRAVECGVVEERRERGSASLYRFSAEVLQSTAVHRPGATAGGVPGALTGRQMQSTVGTLRPGSGSAPSVAHGVASRPVPVTAAPAAGMRVVNGAAVLMIGGVPFPIPPGARPQLEQDEAGRYWYRIGTLHLGPIEDG